MRGAALAIRGHRAVRMGPLKPPAVTRPPLVLIGGTAQWIDSWTGHLRALARERQVLLFECRGQGGATSSLDVSCCDLRTHAEDFAAVVEAGLDEHLLNAPIDVCGFSFGGRVALAAAAAGDGPRIRRLCMSGVIMTFESVCVWSHICRVGAQRLRLKPRDRLTTENVLCTRQPCTRKGWGATAGDSISPR